MAQGLKFNKWVAWGQAALLPGLVVLVTLFGQWMNMLLPAIAGLWPFGSGHIRLPQGTLISVAHRTRLAALRHRKLMLSTPGR